MKKPTITKSLIALLLFLSPYYLFSQSDVCGTPTSIASSTTCLAGVSQLTGQTLSGKTQSSPNVGSSCTGTAGADVWYSFVAQTSNPTISLTTLGTGFQATTSRAYIQILSSCTADVFCSRSAGTAGVTTFSATPTGLTPGGTYYIRIFTQTVAPAGGTWGYTI